MPSITKQEADAYDQMIDAAAELADLIETGGIAVDEYVLEELTIFMAENAQKIRQMFKKLTHRFP
ncbi:YebG family protein [Desulfatitalea tepidiphila]|uniref:YebG family protein n=1 Tax=Desulfatitalea tepidiphila TaxID=1185843 RepID=UPI0006B5FAAE|nr:YebG family protein [Desulfatitalea tepidiphila]